MRRRPAPARVTGALRDVVAAAAPRTPLAAVQAVWRDAVGETVAAQAQPTHERDGVVKISCLSATWANELDLMAEELRRRLNTALGPGEPDQEAVKRLQFSADGARHGVGPD